MGLGVIMIFTVSRDAGQKPLLEVVTTTVTLPLLISDMLGEYVVFKLPAEEKVPVPLLVHCAVAGNIEMVEVSAVRLLFAHTVWSPIAVTIGGF